LADQEKVNPLPQRTEAWAKYNARIAEIRDKFYMDQQNLRRQLDDKIRADHDWYNLELEKLRKWFNDELEKARREFALSV